MLTPDITLSFPATTRWKRTQLKSRDSKFSVAENKNLRLLITSQNPSKFLSVSVTPNLIGSKVSRNEDLREVSLQLVSLKKKHDVNKSLNYRNQFSLDKETKVVEKFKQIENKVVGSSEQISNQVKTLEKLCADLRLRQDEALETRKVYKHMLNRMKLNKMFIDKQNLRMNIKLRENGLAFDEEEYKKRRIKEENIQTKAALLLLEQFVDNETEERLDQLQVLRKDAHMQLKNTENRRYRMKRQLEIAEDAANEERNNRATQVRESLMLHRLFFFLLDIKLQISKKRFAVIDEAFRKIKNQYGNIEPLEMIEKILTREQTYSDLLSSIAQNQEKISEQRTGILEIEEKIEVAIAAKPMTDANRQWRQVLSKSFKENAADKEKLRRLKITKENIKFWANRMLLKLGVQIHKNQDLRSHLSSVKVNILQLLKKEAPRIRKSKIVVDSLSIEEVLKFYSLNETRRRTFATIPIEAIEKIARELSPQDDDDSSRKQLSP